MQTHFVNGVLKRETSAAELRGNHMVVAPHGDPNPMTFEIVFGEAGPPQQIDLKPVLNDTERNQILEERSNEDEVPPQALIAPSFKGLLILERTNSVSVHTKNRGLIVR